MRRILRQQRVQEGAAAARQAGDEHGCCDRLVQDRRIGRLLRPQPQQIAEQPAHVPARAHPAEQVQPRLLIVAGEQQAQRRRDVPGTEIVEARAAAGGGDDLVGVQPGLAAHDIGEADGKMEELRSDRHRHAPGQIFLPF